MVPLAKFSGAVWVVAGAFGWLAIQIAAARILGLRFPAERNQSSKEIWLDRRLVVMNMLVNGILGNLPIFIAGLIIAACGRGLIPLRADGWWMISAVLVYVLL